jgi:cytochrome c biogenesis protein CcdA
MAERKQSLAAAGALIVVVLVATFALTSQSSPWTVVMAGSLLLAAGFVVMTPCQLQMSATMTVVVRNLAARRSEAVGPKPVRRAAVRFAIGYLLFYLPVAVFMGVVAWVLGRYAWVLAIAGGAMSVLLGLAVLGILGRSLLSRCRGPLWLIRSGRASFQKPLKAGIAFGQYCASCCGPYLYALVVLAGATGEFWLGSSLVLLYATTMVVPFLLPTRQGPTPSSQSAYRPFPRNLREPRG